MKQRAICFGIAALFCLWGMAATIIQSPKAGEQSVAAGKPMRTLVAPPRNTNRVSRIQFAWDYPSNGVSFRLYIGRSPGQYDVVEEAGTNLYYVFVRTNWSEAGIRHYAVVEAYSGNDGSPDSNEAHWPAFPPDHIYLVWNTPWPQTVIFTTTNPSIPIPMWDTLATVNGTNYFATNLLMDGQPHFFALNKPEILTLGLFNPYP